MPRDQFRFAEPEPASSSATTLILARIVCVLFVLGLCFALAAIATGDM